MSKTSKNFRASLVAGLLIVIPIGATLWIFLWVLDLLTPWVGEDAPIYIQILMLMALIIVIGIIGWMGQNIFGKSLINFSQSIMNHIPLVNKIYKTLVVISRALSGNTDSFKKVVFLEYPYKGSHTVGFVVGDAPSEVRDFYGEKTYSIFVPTTPNITSGVLIYKPVSDVMVSKISVSEGLKTVLSSGIAKPDDK